MARVKLIVTGKMERRALHTALRRCFPDERMGEAVAWDEPRMVNEVTTHRLEPLGAQSKPSSAMDTLANAMVMEAIIGKRQQEPPADLVVAICDVELGNLDREAIVLSHLRAALERSLAGYESATRERYRRRLREVCSFHFLRPMAEAVFFGDIAALALAGVDVTAHPPRLRIQDVEQFESVDPAWMPSCAVENERQAGRGIVWWRQERHPKRYLGHLVERSGTKVYDELDQGVTALRGLAWSRVTNTQPSPLLRALFEDLACWFGAPNPLGEGAPSPLTSLSSQSPADRWLRNL